MYLLSLCIIWKGSLKEIFSPSVKQDGGAGVEPGEQANTEPEEGGGGKQGSNQADDERKVIKILHQLLQFDIRSLLPFQWFAGKLMVWPTPLMGAITSPMKLKSSCMKFPKRCSLVYQSINVLHNLRKTPITIFRCCFVLITYFIQSSYNNHILTFSNRAQ